MTDVKVRSRVDSRGIVPRVVVMRHPATPKAYASSARTHSARQILLIEESITKFGFTSPTLTDGQDSVSAGHGRLRAAINLGLSQVQTIALGELSEAEKRACRIADNRLGPVNGPLHRSLATGGVGS